MPQNRTNAKLPSNPLSNKGQTKFVLNHAVNSTFSRRKGATRNAYLTMSMQSSENRKTQTQQAGAGARSSSYLNMASNSLKMNVDRARFGRDISMRATGVDEEVEVASTGSSDEIIQINSLEELRGALS